MELEVRSMEAIRLAGIRHVGPYPEIGSAFERLGTFANSLASGKRRRQVAIYWDSPRDTPECELRSDACIELLDDEVAPLGTEPVFTDSGKFAVYSHVGPYSDLGASWDLLFAELHKSDMVIKARPCFEIYVNECEGVPPERLQTDIHIPIQ